MQSINPWIGLDSYREGQILFGRSREIRDLAMAVFYNRQTVVYGRSGIGKSSLLHAGIFPEARLRGCLPISIRFDHSSDVSYRRQLIRTVTNAVTAAGGTMQDILADEQEPQSLWEFYHRYQPLTAEGKPLTPLIVVDQFEEIFTLSRNSREVKCFFDELADLLNDVMPDYLQPKAAEQSKAASGSMFDAVAFSMPQQRYIAEPSYHLVLVLREDYLCYLERYSQRIPALRQNRYSLLPITYEQALEVIMQPRPGLVSREVADAIIRHMVTDEEITAETPVDAAILSLFLSRLYQKKGDNPVINLQLVSEQGDALLKDFYAEVVAPLDRTTVYGLENILINADGHRENVTLETLYKNPWCKREVVETLERNHLLRLFSYGDVQRVEFAHDVLCPIIVHRKEQRENEARYRRSQRRSLIGYFLAFVLFFGIIFAVALINERLSDLKLQRERLNEMQASMIIKGSKRLLEWHSIYEAIRLLTNSLPQAEFSLSNPSPVMANEERVLRSAWDSLYEASFNRVASAEFKHIYFDTYRISKSEELVGFTDYLNATICIYDVKTGSLVQKIEYLPGEGDLDTIITKYWFENGRYIGCSKEYNQNKSRLLLSDIYSDEPQNLEDSRMLIIANDTTVLDCYLWLFDEMYELTRLVLYDNFAADSNVVDARYSPSGEEIAVLLGNDSTRLYSAKTGFLIEGASNQARKIIDEARNRLDKYNTSDVEEYEDGCTEIRNISLTINGTTILRDIGEFSYLEFQQDNMKFISNYVNVDDLYEPNADTLSEVISYISSSTLPEELKYYANSYDIADKGHIDFPTTISPDGKRVMIACYPYLGSTILWKDIYFLYGYYPESGAIFYSRSLPYKHINGVHFTKDGRTVVVDGDDGEQLVLPMHPLPELMQESQSLFFRWRMSDKERYNAYKSVND